MILSFLSEIVLRIVRRQQYVGILHVIFFESVFFSTLYIHGKFFMSFLCFKVLYTMRTRLILKLFFIERDMSKKDLLFLIVIN